LHFHGYKISRKVNAMSLKTSRREFLKISSIVPGGMLLTNSPAHMFAENKTKKQPTVRPGSSEKALKGFVVSDVHFGWRHPAQATNNAISHSLGHILEQFPDLDVFLDSGDIHHGNSYDHGRAEWTDYLAGGVENLPFFVAAGNHELVAFNHARTANTESEERTMSLANLSCRPYFSFDIKNIHFLCLPQLVAVNLVTEEALEWAELDLSINKDKTTIVISHNSLHGTTEPTDSMVYRQVINSEKVFKLLDSHPCVVAWMHGHNHTWELVRIKDRLYSSNGRIGGFSPPYPGNYGAGHLGGMYIEVGPEHFTIRGYSATEKCYFDEIPEYKHLNKTLKLKTSLDCNASSTISWGMGGARDGLIVPAYQHQIASADAKTELFIAGSDTPVFSENSDFAGLAEQTEGWSKARSIGGMSVSPRIDVQGEIDGLRFKNGGVEILPLDSEGQEQRPQRQFSGDGGEAEDEPRKAGRSRSVFSPQWGARSTYYRCVPGHTYKARAVLDSDSSGPACRIVFHIYDSRGNQILEQSSDAVRLAKGSKTVEATCKVPQKAAKGTIYQDPKSEIMINMILEAKIENLLVPVRISKLELLENDASSKTQDVSVKIAGRKYSHRGTLEKNKPVKMQIKQLLPSRDTIEVSAKGNRRLSWLVKQSGVRYQVRNAPAEIFKDGSVAIGPMRNRFSDRQEIVIAPLAEPDTPYVHSIRGIDRCVIEPYDSKEKRLRIHVNEIIGKYQEIRIYNAPGLRNVENVGHRNFEAVVPNSVGVEPLGTGTVTVYF